MKTELLYKYKLAIFQALFRGIDESFDGLVENIAGFSICRPCRRSLFYAKMSLKGESIMRQEIRASHILVKTKEEADKLLNEIKSGKDFAEIASEVSLCPSGRDGGDLGFFGHGVMVKPFDEAAFSLAEIGDVSEPVETQFGWHLIKLTGIIDE